MCVCMCVPATACIPSQLRTIKTLEHFAYLPLLYSISHQLLVVIRLGYAQLRFLASLAGVFMFQSYFSCPVQLVDSSFSLYLWITRSKRSTFSAISFSFLFSFIIPVTSFFLCSFWFLIPTLYLRNSILFYRSCVWHRQLRSFSLKYLFPRFFCMFFHKSVTIQTTWRAIIAILFTENRNWDWFLVVVDCITGINFLPSAMSTANVNWVTSPPNAIDNEFWPPVLVCIPCLAHSRSCDVIKM